MNNTTKILIMQIEKRSRFDYHGFHIGPLLITLNLFIYLYPLTFTERISQLQ